MDPFSIAVGVLAILGAANGVAKVASDFYTVARETKAIRKDVENFASNIHTFGSILDSVYHTISYHCKDSMVVRRFDETLQDLAEQSQQLTDRLQTLQPKVRDHGAGPGFYIRYRWYKGSQKREYNWVWMERIKSYFVMIMLQVILESLEKKRASDDSEELKAQIKDHKRIMVKQKKNIKIWTTRCRDAKDSSKNNTYDSMSDILADVEQLVLAEVATSIPVRKTSRGSSSRYRYYLGDDPKKKKAMGSFAIPPSDQPDGWSVGPWPMQPSLSPGVHPALRPTTEQGANEAENITSIFNDLPGSDIQDWSWNNFDYMAVRPSENFLRMNPEQASSVITGYLDGNDNPIKARLNRDFSENIIWENLAVRLGLHIEHDEDDDQREIEFVGINKGSRQKVRGRVSFSWNGGSGRYRIPVTCLVCEHCPFELVFGSPFISRREYHLRGGPKNVP
ncbi:hypothetical protein HYFRA_00008785 [Hymenoscyphus fraxineus]|uniref:Fungal N-terminal domain-containing protein n=1 Tax=Hymenoscyphus fraxineus TaxID=746836 RepID=A0A9N9L2P3_9HELO|nr:hypothetical protein HYFRA_00008785 [Hymenoscyphus fraxineus]